MQKPEPITLTCTDGQALRAYYFVPEALPRALVLVLPGMGIPQRFFGKLAAWLAQQGFAVLTLDYRGVAESAPAHLGKAHNYLATDWARLDIPAALQHLESLHPGVPLLVLAHSFGGQVLGLVPGAERIRGAVLVGSGTGSQHNYPLASRLKHAVLWHLLFPYHKRTKGYLPGSVMGGAHIPAAAVAQWRQWCLSRDYLFQHIGRSIPPEWDQYAHLTMPLVAYHSTDDRIVTAKGVHHLLAHYPNCRVEARVWQPQQFGQPKVGHVAMFRETFKTTWWKQLATDFRQMAEPVS